MPTRALVVAAPLAPSDATGVKALLDRSKASVPCEIRAATIVRRTGTTATFTVELVTPGGVTLKLAANQAPQAVYATLQQYSVPPGYQVQIAQRAGDTLGAGSDTSDITIDSVEWDE